MFASTNDDGRLTQQTDGISGEVVTYAYDTLKRLSMATTTHGGGSPPQWGLSWTNDRFGNRTAQTVTQGTAPASSLTISSYTNRITTSGWTYDAAGNTTVMPAPVTGSMTLTWDAANRMTAATVSSQTEEYAYDAQNRRVWRKLPNGTEVVQFYGVDGNVLGDYTVKWLNQPSGRVWFTYSNERAWFAGREWGSFVDRLGSRGQNKHFPYGEEKSATLNDQYKFATYYRDSHTGLDYARNRYYDNRTGRFLSPDPYQASAGPDSPGSWNRYVYVEGDPVNFNDPTGEFMAIVAGGGGGGGGISVVPGLLFSVWKWLFGGSRKDPLVEAWKANPGAQVAAWAQNIADARQAGEEQEKRYIAALKVVDDCYTRSPLGNTWIRRFTYQAVDQKDQPFARGEYSVTERNIVVQGGELNGQATWGPSKQNPDGTFSDYIGKLNHRAEDTVQYQTFTATMLNSAGFAPGVANPVMVRYPGYGSGDFGVWGHWMTNGGVRTNNYWHNPETGRKICDDEPIMRFQ